MNPRFLTSVCCCRGRLRGPGALGLHLALRVGIVLAQQKRETLGYGGHIHEMTDR